MNGDDFIKLLGLTSYDPEVKALLAQCGIRKEPKIPRGDETDVIGVPKLGLEITFRDERYLDVKSAKYPDGALVLSNVRMYGDWSPDFKPFTGTLPHGLTFEVKPPQASKKLGRKPAWEDDDKRHVRWDFPNHCVFLRFASDGKLGEVAVQLPLE